MVNISVIFQINEQNFELIFELLDIRYTFFLVNNILLNSLKKELFS